jgi:hypothetical protein
MLCCAAPSHTICFVVVVAHTKNGMSSSSASHLACLAAARDERHRSVTSCPVTRRGAVALTTVAVVFVAGAGGAVWWSGRHGRAGSTPTSVRVATAAVVRTDLASTTQMSGTLGYAGSYAVTGQRAGTVTAEPQPGQVITRGQPAYEVDSTPVYLFYGARPSWRSLAPGVTEGPDVRQLEQNLTALGFADPADLTVDDTFTWATGEAIRRWQQATGQTDTGQLALGAVTYQPGPLRVVGVSVALGAPAPPGLPVLAATSTTPIVTVAVPPAQTFLIHARDMVTVTLPAGNDTPGRVESVSSVATGAPDASGPGGSSGSGSGSGSGGAGQATVAARVTLTHPADAANLDQAPVTVNVTDRAVTGVLAVPITALVALAGGGYGVYVDAAETRRLVGVTPGLFATTLVEVTAPGLHIGDQVEVPAS